MNRNMLSTLSKFLFALFLFSIADTVLYMALDARGPIRALPDSRLYVVGETTPPFEGAPVIPEETDDPGKEAKRLAIINKALSYASDSRNLRLEFHNLKGKMWQGLLIVPPDTPPGAHVITISRTGAPSIPTVDAASEAPSPLMIRVFANSRDYHANFWSLTERYLGIGPWWITLAVIPLAAAMLYLVYREGDLEDERLRREGFGPIYKLAKRKGGWDIIFGLGSRQGVAEGEILSVVDLEGDEVAELVAANVGPDAAKAFLATDRRLRQDYLVTRKRIPS